MSATDRNKIIIAAGVAVVAIIVIVFFLRGRSARESGAGSGGFGAAQTAAATAPGQAAPAAPGGAAAPASPGTTEVAQAAPAEGTALYVPGTPLRMGVGPEEPTREDPFVTFDPPPVPVPPEVTQNLPAVTLQDGGLRPPGIPESTTMIANRRVSGLLFNDGAWAILEQEGESFIVKPGDVVDGNRITAIGPDSLFVTDAEGKRWRVTLRALAPGGMAVSTTSATVPGMPQVPPAER